MSTPKERIFSQRAMAEQLKKTTSDFAGNVSEEVLNQLLCHLLEDGILNDGEVEHISQANQTRANKARELIRTVRMKGDKSCWNFINHIKTRDPKLAEHLGLNLIEPMDMK